MEDWRAAAAGSTLWFIVNRDSEETPRQEKQAWDPALVAEGKVKSSILFCWPDSQNEHAQVLEVQSSSGNFWQVFELELACF